MVLALKEGREGMIRESLWTQILSPPAAAESGRWRGEERARLAPTSLLFDTGCRAFIVRNRCFLSYYRLQTSGNLKKNFESENNSYLLYHSLCFDMK